MTKTDHLAKAKDYIAKGEDFYRKAAEEIKAAMDEDPTLSNVEVGKQLGRSEKWIRDLVKWSTTSESSPTPYSGAEVAAEVDARKVRQAARERPEAIAEAISSAPAEAQQKIADEILKAPNTERSLRNVVKKASEPAPTYELPKAESKLGDAVMRAWEASELLREGEDPPYDAKYRMTTLAEKLERLAIGLRHYLDTGDVDAEFTQLLEEVGADS
jgi:hypothetical protein